MCSKHAPVFFEGSLNEIIDDYDDVPMKEGFMNLGGDVLNYGVCRLFIDVSHPMPLQFRSVFKKNPHSELIVVEHRGRFSVLTNRSKNDILILVMRNAKTSTKEK